MRLALILLATVACLASREAAAEEVSHAAGSRLVLAAADLIESRYVYPDRGRSVAAALRSDPERFIQTDANAFATALTERLRELSEDRHFAVSYSPGRAEDEDGAGGEAMAGQMEGWYGVGVNHGFEAVQRLEGGVGYLDLRVFAPTETAADMMQSAMTLLAQSPALIVDLRENGGGMEDMVLMLAGYLVAPGTEVSGVYNRPSDRHTRSFTPAVVPGRRFGNDKPVYILISQKTFSAAEAFAYDMQAMGRATVVGQRSGGGAHPFEFRELGEGFVLSLPESRSINPATGGDWEGTGVKPDVETAPEQALDAALRLALGAAGPGATGPSAAAPSRAGSAIPF